MTLRSRLIGCGSYLPARIVTNHDLAGKVDTSHDWIVQRTGIEQRHVAAEGETTSDLAVAASRAALKSAGIGPGDVDMIVLATTTPDETFPATATIVQHRLGMQSGFAFDVQAVCSGFVYALAIADNFLRVGQARTALVIGAENFTRLLDWDDRTTCVLFGDGAGAVVLRATAGEGTIADRGILSTHLHSDGAGHDILYTDGGPSKTGTMGFVRMTGRDVFKHAVAKMAAAVTEALQANDLAAEEIDWMVPHQANRRIIEATAKKLNMSTEKVITTVDRHANTSAASIPLAFAEAVQDGRIRENQLVLFEALGGGLTWGSALVRI